MEKEDEIPIIEGKEYAKVNSGLDELLAQNPYGIRLAKMPNILKITSYPLDKNKKFIVHEVLIVQGDVILQYGYKYEFKGYITSVECNNKGFKAEITSDRGKQFQITGNANALNGYFFELLETWFSRNIRAK